MKSSEFDNSIGVEERTPSFIERRTGANWERWRKRAIEFASAIVHNPQRAAEMWRKLVLFLGAKRKLGSKESKGEVEFLAMELSTKEEDESRLTTFFLLLLIKNLNLEELRFQYCPRG